MPITLENTETLLSIVVALLGAIGIIGGWVAVANRRQWAKTEKAIDEREKDHKRDLIYFERRDRDQQHQIAELRDDLASCKDDLRRSEDHNGPPRFQL